MPYSEAFYLASTDKIYGVMENYIVKCNATTGLKESSAKICSPCYGPMRITGSGASLYVSAVNDFSLNRFAGVDLPTTNKQIWTVDPTTLAATNTLLLDDVWQAWMGGSTTGDYPGSVGPRAMAVTGGYIYFVYTRGSGSYYICRINLTNPADNQITNTINPTGSLYQYCETFEAIGSDFFVPEPNLMQMRWFQLQAPFLGNYFALYKNPSTAPYKVTSCVYVASNSCVYCVSGSDIMHKYDTVGFAISTLNLGTVLSNGYPIRIRISPLDGKLYIPSQFDDSITVWDTATETGVLKSGFISPIDVVFTASKAFAVQSGVQSLKEII